eukprot:g11446.t1
MPLVLLSPSQASKAPRSRSSQERRVLGGRGRGRRPTGAGQKRPKAYKERCRQRLVLGPSRGKAGVELPEAGLQGDVMSASSGWCRGRPSPETKDGHLAGLLTRALGQALQRGSGTWLDVGPLQCTVRECCRDAHRELARGELQKRETLQCLGLCAELLDEIATSACEALRLQNIVQNAERRGWFYAEDEAALRAERQLVRIEASHQELGQALAKALENLGVGRSPCCDEGHAMDAIPLPSLRQKFERCMNCGRESEDFLQKTGLEAHREPWSPPIDRSDVLLETRADAVEAPQVTWPREPSTEGPREPDRIITRRPKLPISPGLENVLLAQGGETNLTPDLSARAKQRAISTRRTTEAAEADDIAKETVRQFFAVPSKAATPPLQLPPRLRDLESPVKKRSELGVRRFWARRPHEWLRGETPWVDPDDGLRKSFEDCHLLDQESAICGVFDGHLGDEAAAFCAERLHLFLAKAEGQKHDTDSVRKAFGACDAELRDALPKGCEAGSTATIVKLLHNHTPNGVNGDGTDGTLELLVASCGDSRAMLWRKADGHLEVTQDHRPTDPSERKRIEAAGGTVELERVDGQLACSRALGAFAFKDGQRPKVSFEPEVYHWKASRGDWLILACDGIWDTISNEQAVERICKSDVEDLGVVLESLLHFCIDREADDNLTLLAVELGSIPHKEQTTSMSAGNFLKTKDEEVLQQYAAFCKRFGYCIHKEVQEKGPPVVSLSKTDPGLQEPTPVLPRFPLNEAKTSRSTAPTPLVIVGPSGVGKGTLIAKIREGFAGRFGFSVSHTTRKPRPGEVHGEAYNFVDMETMQKELKIPGRFLEHATVHGNLYGTSQEAVEKKIHSDFNYLFIAPPSVESLEKRLRARGTETEEKIQTRLRNARSEIDFYKENVDFFNDVLVNDDLGLASSRALDLMRSWYPELVQQVKITARRPAAWFVHAARELIAERPDHAAPAELEVSGLGSALERVTIVSSALESDGHKVVAVNTSMAEEGVNADCSKT